MRRLIIIGLVVLAVGTAGIFAWMVFRPDRCDALFDKYEALKNEEALAVLNGDVEAASRPSLDANLTRSEANDVGCDTRDWVDRLGR